VNIVTLPGLSIEARYSTLTKRQQHVLNTNIMQTKLATVYHVGVVASLVARDLDYRNKRRDRDTKSDALAKKGLVASIACGSDLCL
jgi:hypothetical protein